LEVKVLSRFIRILVLGLLPMEQQNAVLAFFSFNAEKVRFALYDGFGNLRENVPTGTARKIGLFALSTFCLSFASLPMPENHAWEIPAFYNPHECRRY
jgi:hypothetical protein